MSERRSSKARWLLAAGACVAIVLLWNLPRSSELPFNWDSVNYALGAEQYDLRLHQPHPPGYPLWILAVRLLTQLGLSANLAQILLAQLSVAVALLALIDLARARGRAAQAFVGVALLVCPLVAMHARLAGTYSSELMSSALVAWACADLWRGRSRRGLVAVLAWILAAGLRTSGAVFLGPLLVVSLWRGFPGRRRRALALMFAAGLGALLCYVPVWQSLGPLPGSFLYWRVMLDRLFQGPLDASSWFRGAPLDAHLGLLVRLATWWIYGLIAFVPALFLLRGSRGAPAQAAHADDSAPRATPAPAASAPAAPAPTASAPAAAELDAPPTSAAFLMLWAAPSLAFLLLIYAPHPGYVLAPLPAMLLALARWVPRAAVSRARLVTALASAVIAAELLALPRFGPLDAPGVSPSRPSAALAHATPAQIAASDEQLLAIRELLAERPAEEPVLVFEIDWNLANWRKLAWVLPERPVWWLNAARGGLAWMQARRRHESAELRVDAQARALWIVVQSEQLPEALARDFPGAERALLRHSVSVWRADLSAATPETLTHGPQRWPLKRE